MFEVNCTGTVNQILCSSRDYERLQNSKDSLKGCIENVNITACWAGTLFFIIVANSADPDQAQQNVMIWIHTVYNRMVLKKSADDKKHEQYPLGKELIHYL